MVSGKIIRRIWTGHQEHDKIDTEVIFLKPLNVLLALILALALAFLGFFFYGSMLSPQVSRITAEAAAHPEAFSSIRNVIEGDSAPQMFSYEEIGSAGNYRLIDVNITLENKGIFDAEWLNITVGSAPGDVAVYSLSGQGSDVSARSASAVNFKLITRADENAPRSAEIQYYVFGLSRTIRVDF